MTLDFVWEGDQGLGGGAWIAWTDEGCATVQPLHADGTCYVDQAPLGFSELHAWWYDDTEDRFLDPVTRREIATYATFEVSDAPVFGTLDEACAAFAHVRSCTR